MVELLSLVLGLLLLGVALVDLLWTALWITGKAGPLSGRLSRAAWRVMLRVGWDRHRLLSLFGPLSLVAAIALWSAMLWFGWTLVFGADAGSVRDADTGVPGDFGERLYFTGYAIFTMGNGDVVPAPAWRVPTVLMNATGLVLLTLAVSYLISVLSAVVSARAFASRVASLGECAQDILLAGYGGDGLRALEGPLSSFATDLSRISEQQAAYPVLEHYRPEVRSKAVPPAVATLDDVLALLEALPEETVPSRTTRRSLRGAIEGYLAAVDGYASDRRRMPPPRVAKLRRAGLVLDDDKLPLILDGASARRSSLARVMANQGWSWPEG